MRRLGIGHHDFAENEHAVLALRVRIDGNRLQHAVGAAAFGLHRRGTVEAPEGQLLKRRKSIEFLDQGLAAQVRGGLVTVEPDVFELELCHFVLSHDARNGWVPKRLGNPDRLPDDRCPLRSINRANSNSAPRIQRNLRLAAGRSPGEQTLQRKEEANCAKNRQNLPNSAAKQSGKAEINGPSPAIAGDCL
ncbi:hypothetical protein D9M72_507020 [compost metagenome]